MYHNACVRSIVWPKNLLFIHEMVDLDKIPL